MGVRERNVKVVTKIKGEEQANYSMAGARASATS